MKNLILHLSKTILVIFIISITSCNQNDFTDSVLPINKDFDLDSNFYVENPNWILTLEDYVNESGSIGDLFTNYNNPMDTLFEIDSISERDKPRIMGTYRKDHIGGYSERHSCYEPKKDCWVVPHYNGEALIGITIYVERENIHN